MQLVNQVGTVHADKIFPIQMLGYPRQRSGYQDSRHAVHVQRAITSARLHIQDMLHQDALESVIHFHEYHGIPG